MKFFSLSLFLAIVVNVYSVDFWQHPEAAERNSLFVSASFPELNVLRGFDFDFQGKFSFDYILPVRFPFSLGAFMRLPDPNLNSFGTRFAYHINLDAENIDLYFLYVFDFGFLRNDLLEEYGDKRVDMHTYDFRAGIRYRINRFIFLQIESGFKFQTLIFGLSAKLF